MWRLPNLVLSLTLKGHKRGIWAVAFSPVDQAVATASGESVGGGGYGCWRMCVLGWVLMNLWVLVDVGAGGRGRRCVRVLVGARTPMQHWG